MGGKKGKKKSKKKKSYTKAQKMAKARIAAKKTAPKATKTKSTPASTGRAPSKVKTKAQQMATARIAAGKTISQVKAANKQSMKDAASDRNKKFKQTKVQTFGGKKTSFTPKEQTRIKDAGYKVSGYSQAKFKPTPKPTPKVDRIDGARVAGLFGNKEPKKITYPGQERRDLLKQIKKFDTMSPLSGGPGGVFKVSAPVDGDKLAAADADSSMSGLGIKTTPSYFKTSPAESYGYPSQAEVDKAAGITAGGLNIGGGGFTPSNPIGNRNARALFPGASPNSAVFGMTDAQLNQPGGPFAQPGPTPENTPEADYTSYQPGSFYDQSDTNMNATNLVRSGRTLLTAPLRALGINNQFTNRLIPMSDGAIQAGIDNRSQYNIANNPRPTLKRRKGGGGGARIPVAPLTPEEILLPEETAVAQAAPAYQQAQTGVDPNRLMQIQQEAYLQAFNPSYNPMFRFFGRRGMGRGSFRKAFRRRD